MTKKWILGSLLCVVTIGSALAQNYEVYNDFMQKYMRMTLGYQVKDTQAENGWRMVTQVGTPMPDFYFNSKLNSKALKGKFVVLDFWATWCGGCRVLSHCLDSLMIKGTDLYTKNGVQLIGVDYKENMIDKGYKARQYWKEKGYGFPNVDTKGVQECGDATHAGHPTALVVDDKGIIRYRVDGAGYHTAGQIMFALWALKFLPESGLPMTMATAQQFFAENEFSKGLYVLYHLPATQEVDVMKFRYALDVNSWMASYLFDELDKKYKTSADYQTVIRKLVEIVLEKNVASVYQRAWTILQDFNSHGTFGKEKRETITRLCAILQSRYGCSIHHQALRMLESQLKYAKESGMDADQMKLMEEALESCKANQ